jgi:hypothetical protein
MLIILWNTVERTWFSLLPLGFAAHLGSSGLKIGSREKRRRSRRRRWLFNNLSVML